MDNGYILEMNHIAKIYGNGVVANADVNFNLKEGEIHALVGENGAGKSTLMKMLFGMEQPSRGEIILRAGKPSCIYCFHTLNLLRFFIISTKRNCLFTQIYYK